MKKFIKFSLLFIIYIIVVFFLGAYFYKNGIGFFYFEKKMSNITAYIILIIAVVLGTASNGFAKSAQGFTLLVPSIITAVTIVGCMYTLSLVMKTIPVGITYASFAGLCIIATTIVGMYQFKQIPDLYTLLGLALIIAGVLIVNLLGKAN